MRAWTPSCLLVVALSGCTCGGPGVSTRKADLMVVLPGTTETLSKDATLSFPNTPMGQTSSLVARLRNVGLAEATLTSLALVEGSAAFGSALPSVTSLPPSAEAELELTFTPPFEGDPTVPERRHQATFVVRADGTAPDDAELRLRLDGLGLTGDCELPATVDFGDLLLETTVTTGVPLALSAGTQALEVGSLDGADAAAFAVDPASLQVRAPSGAAALSFTAREARAYTASLRWRRAAHCPWATTQLRGAGGDDALTLEPRQVDFGDVPLQQSASRLVTLRSRAGVALPVIAVAVEGDGFTNASAALRDVPARSTVALDVRCSPTAPGALTGTLRVTVGSRPERTLSASLTCRGGGPRLRLSPSGVLAFGVIPYFQGTIVQTTRRLTVTNVGNPAPAPNLLLGRGGGALPYFAFVPVTGPVSDWQVHVASTYRPDVGLPAVAGASLELTVAFKPAALGRREVDLLVYSNDAVAPVARVRLTADGRTSDGCALMASPASIELGPLPPGIDVLSGVNVRNTSSVDCTLSGLELVAAAGSPFALEPAPAPSITIRPGQSTVIAVRTRVAPGAVVGTTYGATLRFHTSDVTRQLVEVPVSTYVSACVVLSPATLDFGTTRPGCRTAPRTAYVYNTCGVPVTLQTISPVPTPFSSVTTPSIPSGGLLLQVGAAPRAIQVAYAPQQEGQHTGAVDLVASIAGTSRTLTLQLRGRALTEPVVEESFTQPAVAQTDILLTIDDSCSMFDEQAALASNLNAFLGHATSRGLDFQLGVTTTDDSTTGARGRLLWTPTNPRILRSTTPQLQTLFADKVQVGTGGSGTEMPLSTTVRALTPPLIDGENAGLLRPDAALGVIIVTDAVDQSPEPFSSYVDRLLGVKGPGQSFLISVSVVGPFTATPNCNIEGQVDNGRFRPLVQQTGGVRADVCTAQWAQDLARIAEAAFGARRTFPLSARPEVTQPISVTVNGQPAPGAGFDATANAVDFGQSPPPRGATVTVRYTPACF